MHSFEQDGAPAFSELRHIATKIVAALGPQRLSPARYDAGVDAAMDADILCELAVWLVHAIGRPEIGLPNDQRCFYSCVALMLALHARAWDIAATLAAEVYTHYGRREEEHGVTPPIYAMIMRGVRDQAYPTWRHAAAQITAGRGTQSLMAGESSALIWLVQATHQHAHPNEPLPE